MQRTIGTRGALSAAAPCYAARRDPDYGGGAGTGADLEELAAVPEVQRATLARAGLGRLQGGAAQGRQPRRKARARQAGLR